MSTLLNALSQRLITELGLVAHLVDDSEGDRIVGGIRYVDTGEYAFYIKKYEVWMVAETYAMSLPLGQTFLKLYCKTQDEVIEAIFSHFNTYYPEDIEGLGSPR